MRVIEVESRVKSSQSRILIRVKFKRVRNYGLRMCTILVNSLLSRFVVPCINRQYVPLNVVDMYLENVTFSETT